MAACREGQIWSYVLSDLSSAVIFFFQSWFLLFLVSSGQPSCILLTTFTHLKLGLFNIVKSHTLTIYLKQMDTEFLIAWWKAFEK